MASGIDHVVIAVADPDAAATELSEGLGLAFTAGGRHSGLGTFNRIAFLGDAYLELMGVDDPAAAARWAIGEAAVRILNDGGGFATYGLLDDAIRHTVARLRANGSRIGPVLHGSRERPDGELVEWWTASPARLGPDQPPFLIKHLAAGAEWGTEALAERRADIHPAGSPIILLGLEIGVVDPIGLASACAQEIGLEFTTLDPGPRTGAVAEVGRQVIRLVRSDGQPAGPRVVLGDPRRGSRTAVALGVEFAVRSIDR